MTGPSEGKKSLLIVEDEQILRQALAAELADTFCVFQAADGLEAVTFLTTHTVDLVLTDLSMPRMDGLHLIRIMRQRWPGIKVVLCTRQPLTEIARRMAPLRVEGLIAKPFTHAEVTRVIEQALAGREARTEITTRGDKNVK